VPFPPRIKFRSPEILPSRGLSPETLSVETSRSLQVADLANSNLHTDNFLPLHKHTETMQHPNSVALLSAIYAFTLAAAGGVPRGVGPECMFVDH